MNFTAIDFETANDKGHPCSLGLAVVENNEIVRRESWLIRPYELNIPQFYTDIHHISEDMVRDMPEFNERWESIRIFLDGQTIIAHNAGFDIGVLKNALRLYDLPHPEFDYFCTVDISRKVWPRKDANGDGVLENHKLNTVAKHLNVDFSHHDASDDAFASAIIALEAGREKGFNSLHELADHLKIKTNYFK
jgi:DNA polymerase III subunit epsilon